MQMSTCWCFFSSRSRSIFFSFFFLRTSSILNVLKSFGFINSQVRDLIIIIFFQQRVLFLTFWKVLDTLLQFSSTCFEPEVAETAVPNLFMEMNQEVNQIVPNVSPIE